MTIVKSNLAEILRFTHEGSAESLRELCREFRFYTQPLEWDKNKSYRTMGYRYFNDSKMIYKNRDHIIYDDIQLVNTRLKQYYKGKFSPNYIWNSTIEPYLKMYDFKYDQLLEQVENLNSPIMPLRIK